MTTAETDRPANPADLDLTAPPPPFEPGTLVAYADYSTPPAFDDTIPKLALTLSDPSYSNGEWWYGLEFVQTPEAGEPRGGRQYSERASKLRLPTSMAEILAAARYRAALRVRLARGELALAEKERDAVELAVAVIEREATR